MCYILMIGPLLEEKYGSKTLIVLVAIFFIGQQVIQGLTVRDNISNMAHIVGGIIGV